MRVTLYLGITAHIIGYLSATSATLSGWPAVFCSCPSAALSIMRLRMQLHGIHRYGGLSARCPAIKMAFGTSLLVVFTTSVSGAWQPSPRKGDSLAGGGYHGYMQPGFRLGWGYPRCACLRFCPQDSIWRDSHTQVASGCFCHREQCYRGNW